MVKGGHPMIGPSKILTVSYGTFSCTLEGFDDPFNTMRAIAEYFRDLAAEDRYFGAEPPTPDAAMLLKIAEREVQRRVEAKIGENGVVLRTGDAMQAPSYPPTAQAQSPMPAVQSRAVPTPQPAPMPEGVAAKLLRIRAAVANAELSDHRAEVAPVARDPVPVQPILADYSEDQHADDTAAITTISAAFAPEAVFDANDAWEPVESATANPTFETNGFAEEFDEGDADADADTTAFEDEAPFLSADEADELADMEAVEAVALAVVKPTPDVQLASNASPEDDALLAALNWNAAATFDDIADGEAESNLADADPLDNEITEDELADLRALDGDADSTGLVAVPAQTQTLVYDEDLGTDIDAGLETAERDTADTPLDDESEKVADALETSIAAIDPVIEEIDSVYGADPTGAAGPSDKVLRARARVIKVRRDDMAADSDAPSTDIAAAGANALGAAAEAELRRELRALKSLEPAPVVSLAADEGDETGPEDDARQRLDPTGEAAVSRLIEQTNEVMAVPENRRRLSAIAHLKAAVAATVADRFAKGGTTPKEVETKRLDPYREDLARVVRPQNPTGADEAAAAPRPAPLVLVSAQRIDRPRTDGGASLTAVPDSPVRPRRVTSAALAVDPEPQTDEDEDIDTANVFSDARGFADFSERLGANSLAEILEAAAAYSVCIEGRPYFSRPQLMSQIGALSADSEYTREDGLRTFGALLREGRIQKIKRGQFVLTESSRYLAEARSMAG